MNNKTSFLVQFSILVAIEAIFCFVPILGSIPIGPLVATLSMIPVIITAILFGTKTGTIMGAIAGLFSFIVWTFMPPSPALAFTFTPFYSLGEFHGNFGSILICFVPRILVGTVTGFVYKILPAKDFVKMIIASLLGSLTNTVGVLGGTWLFFGGQCSTLIGNTMLIIVGTLILTNGIPEAIVSAIIAPSVCKPAKRILNQNH